ncbi:hypothetical protein F8388_019303, partial [Cannabis sativa]
DRTTRIQPPPQLSNPTEKNATLIFDLNPPLVQSNETLGLVRVSHGGPDSYPNSCPLYVIFTIRLRSRWALSFLLRSENVQRLVRWNVKISGL